MYPEKIPLFPVFLCLQKTSGRPFGTALVASVGKYGAIILARKHKDLSFSRFDCYQYTAPRV